VVRNGYAPPREVLTSSGAIEVLAPRVNDKRVDEVSGERARFASAILPPWCRKSPKVNEVLPLLYLHGLSSNDFGLALEQFLGTGAGLSGPTITRLTAVWQQEAKTFNTRDLSGVDYVYVWADGIHVNIRLEAERLCLLVLIGVRADGTKELITLSDGQRESAGSWADLLRDAKRRGMGAPVLAAGDGALGFLSALGEVFPETRPQRCWFHKIANVLSALPKSAHPGAKKALGEIWNAEDKTHARAAVAAFEAPYGAKFPKAGAKITHDVEELLAFYDFPAEHWIHLRTTNPIESTFATARHRTKVTKGPRVQGRRDRHGVQADQGRPGPVAHGERTTSGRLRARLRPLRERQTPRTRGRLPCRTGRQANAPGDSSLKDLHPQVLTIARCDLPLHRVDFFGTANSAGLLAPGEYGVRPTHEHAAPRTMA